VVVAAGNAGDEGYFSIGAPATAKNCLAVGASMSSKQSWEQVYAILLLNGIRMISKEEKQKCRITLK